MVCTGGWLGSHLFLLLAAAGLFARKKDNKNFCCRHSIPILPAAIFYLEKIHRVLLKEDVLSIDLKDNHFYQFVLQPGDNPGLQQMN